MEGIAGSLFALVVLIFSVVVHEVSHGYVAERLGDPTARMAGRLTLNPLKHLDPIGSFLVPLATFFLFGFMFGWARPVPYNPFHLKDPKKAAGIIAAAGPLSNFFIAVVFGILFRLALLSGNVLFLSLVPFFAVVVMINVLLGVFNLVPIPPLDGSKVLFAFLPPTETGQRIGFVLERYGFMILILFLFFGFQFIIPIIEVLFRLIVGQGISVAF